MTVARVEWTTCVCVRPVRIRRQAAVGVAQTRPESHRATYNVYPGCGVGGLGGGGR